MTQNNEKLNRFINLLEGIFELNKADLDFGIYRIMNIRKDEIKQFLSVGLPKKVQEALAPFAADTGEIAKRIAEIEQQASDLGIEITASPKLADEYSRLKSQLAAGVDMSSLETDVYSSLYSFFNRYYDEGDFISKRRYKEGVYAIPYEGEEVKLHWANADQYYIKTSENFRDYTFISNGKKAHFRLVDVTTEKNNNKESDTTKRVFMLYTEAEDKPDVKTIEEVDGELVIRFIYDVPADKKAKHDELNIAAISDAIAKQFKDWYHLLAPASGAKKETRSVLEKHLNSYIAKNTFDYFIHKDLRGFLTRELDFYIKSEVIHLDDIDTSDERRADSYLAKVRAIKRVGKILIDFLAQIEDFQKKLWLKKKFVVSTNWCITLDRVDESFYPEIIGNSEQIAEWRDMYAIDEIQGDLTAVGYSDQLTVDFLRQNKNLVLDTRHFTADFKDRLVASIDNLDEQTGGLMIHSENFQALQLLTERYKGQVKCVYIDPPFNAKSSEILYKNTFKHSSWISLLENRISISHDVLHPEFVYVIAIDEVENNRLGMLLLELFPSITGNTSVSVIINPSGQQGKNFSTTNETIHFLYKDDNGMLQKEQRGEDTADVRGFMNGAKGDTGNYLRESGKTCFYPITVQNGEVVGFGDVCDDEFHPGSANVVKDDTLEIYPIDADGVERKWLFGRDTVESIIDELSVGFNKNRQEYEIIRTKTNINFKTVWTDKKYSAKTHGTTLLREMFGKSPFSFPKSLYAVQDCVNIALNAKSGFVLDFFGGSATTAHAVIYQNSNDKGMRKYLLAEMGEYFNTVTLPRVKKAIYAPNPTDWKGGKPQNRNTGVSHIMKYIVLESYEDALSNIELSDDMHRLMAFFGEDYMLRYMFDAESKDSVLSLDAFNTPFGYTLKINENNETKEKLVDLCETFNYLLGLSVIRQTAVSHFHAILDPNGEYENAVQLSREDKGEYGFKQIEGRLPDGRRALVIWRNVTKDLLQSNAALDAYFGKHRINPADREFDVIFVNGDNNLENLRLDDESWKVQRIEPVFKTKMFEEAE